MDLIGPIAGQARQLPGPARDVDLDADRLAAGEFFQTADEVESGVEFFAKGGRLVAAAALDGDGRSGNHGRHLDCRVVDGASRFRPQQAAGRQDSGGAKRGREEFTTRGILDHAMLLDRTSQRLPFQR
jgi:hypothetical protein